MGRYGRSSWVWMLDYLCNLTLHAKLDCAYWSIRIMLEARLVISLVLVNGLWGAGTDDCMVLSPFLAANSILNESYFTTLQQCFYILSIYITPFLLYVRSKISQSLPNCPDLKDQESRATGPRVAVHWPIWRSSKGLHCMCATVMKTKTLSYCVCGM